MLAPASVFGVGVSPGAFSLIWLNSPFDAAIAGGRTEVRWLQQVTPWLAPGGVVALVCPASVVENGYADLPFWMREWYENVTVLPFGEAFRKFNEVIVLAVKRAKPAEFKPSWDKIQAPPGFLYHIPKAENPRYFAKTGPTEQECDKGFVPIDPSEANRKKLACEFVLDVEGYSNGKPIYGFTRGCGERLWQMTRQIDRYEPATYVKRKLPGFFDYLLLDEMHQEKAPDSGQANAAGSLIAASKKTIGLTGTLAGGYAWHLKGLLFRMAPRSLVREGQTWSADTAFNECYGRIETTVRTTTGTKDCDFDAGDENRMSRGSASRSVTKSVRPGIMPSLYARHLLDKAVFLSLDQVSDALPALTEECMPPARLRGRTSHRRGSRSHPNHLGSPGRPAGSSGTSPGSAGRSAAASAAAAPSVPSRSGRTRPAARRPSRPVAAMPLATNSSRILLLSGLPAC